MPIVCIERANRSKPRLFKARDAGRIACRVLEQGTATQEEILAEVYKCMDDPCSRGFWLDLLDAIAIILEIINAIITSVRIIRNLLKIIDKTVGRIPIVRVTVRSINLLLRRIKRLEDATGKLEDLATVGREIIEQLPE